MKTEPKAFTIVELLAVIGMLTLLACIAVPALTRTNPVSKTSQCMNNLRQLTAGFRAWSVENNDVLLTCQDPIVPGGGGDTYGTPNSNRTRPIWITGVVDFTGSNRSNWDINQDIAVGPMWNYIGKSAGAFKCPADASQVIVSGQLLPRVRSFSMSQAFSRGEWLDPGNSPSFYWRTYYKMSQIALPTKTFVFVDEHPDSINDAAFAFQCGGNQPTDPQGSARIIDFPASRHMNGANLSFSDGHVETHRWIGTTMRPIEAFNGAIPLNVPAGDSWMDAHWLAANTTVRK